VLFLGWKNLSVFLIKTFHLLATLVALAAAGYLIIAALLFFFQSNLIYYPESTLVSTPGAARLPYEEASLRTQDGVRLHGWYLPAQQHRGVLLHCHGNAGNISHRLDVLEFFHRLGLSVFIFDYRGYGKSAGRPDESGTYRDAEAAWDYLVTARGIAPGEVIVHGQSLGGAVAAWLAHRHTPGALILESAFTSVEDLAGELYPYLPVRWLTRYHYPTIKFVRDVKCPVLVVHSRGDEIIAFSHGQRLFEAAPEPKAFLEIWGSHNEGFLRSAQLYQTGLQTFISQHLAGR
jgi:uncharacterized protein